MAILILENGYNDLVRSRIPLGEYFQSKGLKVHYACPKPERDIAYEVPMSRSSLAPLKLIKGFRRLNQIENKLSVDMLLSFRFIPNVLNYLASFSNKKVTRPGIESSPVTLRHQPEPLSIVEAITIKRDVPRGVEPISVTRR